MSESQITKKALAVSIKQLMGTIPLAKISIQNIVNNCGLNRQTFYYHFKDKYELVNWIFYTEAIESIADYKNYTNWCDGMYRTLSYIMGNKSFYINALQTQGQNTFDSYFFEVSYQLILEVLHNLSLGLNVSDSDKKFIADFYTHAFVGITVQWIKKGMEESPRVIVDKLNDIVEGSMMGALTRYTNSQQHI